MDSRSPDPRSRAGALRLFTVVFWILFGAISGLQIQVSMLSHHHSWALVLGYQVLVWAVWIPCSFAIFALVHRWPVFPVRPPAIAAHLLVSSAFAVAHVAFWVGVELWFRPYDFMNPVAFLPRFSDMMLVQGPLEVVLYALVALAYHAIMVTAREREREQQAAKLEQSLAEARLQAVRLQIQPHFLFNTLNAIGSLIRGGQDAEAIAMLGGLSDLLRYSLDHAGGARVPLETEAAMVERYLGIQRTRFADRLAVEIDVAPDTRRAEVPVLLLQPLVENAVQHGIATSNNGGRVTLRARRYGGILQLELFNTGRLVAGKREGIGLSTTVSRLAQMYGERSHFELREEEGGVMARVAIPWSVAP